MPCFLKIWTHFEQHRQFFNVSNEFFEQIQADSLVLGRVNFFVPQVEVIRS